MSTLSLPDEAQLLEQLNILSGKSDAVARCLTAADAVEKLQFLEIVVEKLTRQGNVRIRRDGSRKDRRKLPAITYEGLKVRWTLISW